jgi:hypothetical protein
VTEPSRISLKRVWKNWKYADRASWRSPEGGRFLSGNSANESRRDPVNRLSGSLLQMVKLASSGRLGRDGDKYVMTGSPRTAHLLRVDETSRAACLKSRTK